MSAKRFSNSEDLFQRALAVIPGGVYGHQSPQYLVEGAYPKFISRAEGCRLQDPDGNEYIDFLCAYGPMVVGYANPAVEAAAAAQRALCDSGNLPAPNAVELAERLVELTPGGDWALFAKNGSDVCSWALAIARDATGRDMTLMVDGTYHGVHGWCNHMQLGFPPSDRAAVAKFEWNDLSGAERLFSENPGRVAALIITPFRHEAGADSVLPAPGFIDGLRGLCDTHGAVLVVDDVRAGFRLHTGGSTQLQGVTPDLLIYSKALANGYPLSAIVGADALRPAAKKVFVTGTFFTQAVPIAAALATLDWLLANDGIEHMRSVGTRFCEGLEERARAAGLAVTVSGPPAIPFLTFDADAGSFKRSRVFAAACAANGVFLHPVHNWFVSTAHGEADIDEALGVAELAFAEVASRE